MSNFDSKAMENTLYLDIGNTSVKGAYRENLKWKPIHSEAVKNASDFLKWIDANSNSFDTIYLCSVRSEVTKAIRHELPELPIREITVDDIPSENLDYETPKTLGIDRFLSCYGAIAQTDKAAVVIDAGTACTVDFMTDDEIFWGGVIVPGYSSFVQILKDKAPVLPVVMNEIPGTWPGKSTEDALKWGIPGFYRDGLLALLDRYREKLSEFDLFLTGGNAGVIQKILDRDLKTRPFLVFDGMERFAEKLD